MCPTDHGHVPVVKNLTSFWLIIKQQWTNKEISCISNRCFLDIEWGCQTLFWKGTTLGSSQSSLG